ncbi:MAG TPA: amidohydrolase family protein [Stellaceae bacterium]|nr:amidohydrolase family protein [Stellaceae bacterium]
MKIVTIEDHFATPMMQEKRPPIPQGPGEGIAARGRQLGHDIEAELVDLTGSRIAAMDAAGIDVQVVSLTMPGTEAFPADIAIPMATDANDRLAAAVKKHPTRLAGFAALPTADPAAAAKELERAVKRLGFKGAMINGHCQGNYLDDKKYWPIFEAAQALDVPIYLHPREPHPNVMRTYFAGYEDLALPAWGFAMETCTHFLRLMMAGVFDAFPKFTMILGHLGEGLPFWLHRLDDHTSGACKRRGLKRSSTQYLRENVVVTTSGNFYTPAFLCTVMALGIDNVIFSVDWPYESNTLGRVWLDGLPLSGEDKEKVAHRNAERVLKL